MLQGFFYSLLAGVTAAGATGLGAPAATVIPGEAQALISWTAPMQSINGIDIEESIDSGNSWVPVTKLPPDSTHLRVQNLIDGKNYWFRVRWIWPDNSFGIPSATLVVVPIQNPDAPSGLVATTNDTQVALSWDQSTNKSITGYEIEQSTDGGTTWKVIDQNTGTSSTGYLVDGLNAGTTYTYRIKAIAFGGVQSEYSDSAVVKIGTPTPGGFPLNYSIVANKVILTWQTPQDLTDVATYQVNASADGGVNWFTVATTQGGTNTAAVPYVIGGSTYQVIATSGSGATSSSAIELVQTNALSESTPSALPDSHSASNPASNPAASQTPSLAASTPASSSFRIPLIPIALILTLFGVGAWLVLSFENRKFKLKSQKRAPQKRKSQKKRKPKKRKSIKSKA